MKSRHVIGQVTESQRRRAERNDYQLGNARRGDQLVLLEAALVARGYVVLDVVVAVSAVENGIEYV